MSYRKYLTCLLSGLFALIAICIAAIIVIDPAFQYHKSILGIKPVYSNERYQNSGIIKNYDYDSVVLGSSVTANFRASQFDELFGGKTVKLTFPGGCFKDFDSALSLAYQTHDIKRVFWSIDPKILMTKYDEQSTPLPDFLYNTSVLDDSKYLLNKDVLIEMCGKSILATLKGSEQNFDDAFSWDSEYEFSYSQALWGYARPKWSDTVVSADKYDKIVNENIAHIKSFIENHPETEFYLFTPPYSVLYWDRITRDGTYPAVLKLFDKLIYEFSQYDNVKYYCFATDLCILNLNNYIDEVHFSGDINRQMAEYMANNNGLTPEYIPQMHQFFRNIIEYYDFESIFPVALHENPPKRRTLSDNY